MCRSIFTTHFGDRDEVRLDVVFVASKHCAQPSKSSNNLMWKNRENDIMSQKSWHTWEAPYINNYKNKEQVVDYLVRNEKNIILFYDSLNLQFQKVHMGKEWALVFE